MSIYSSAGPDGYNGALFHSCWDIIKTDVIDFVQSSFNGEELTKFYNHTCLTLIPKKVSPETFAKFRPISLSNLTSKIISKLLAVRLTSILEKLISDNRSGFLKGRLITEMSCLHKRLYKGFPTIIKVETW